VGVAVAVAEHAGGEARIDDHDHAHEAERERVKRTSNVDEG
jgi:hypothetical protein